jgi:predicted small lipoprotein YifL
MRNAPKALILALGVVAVAACHKQPQPTAAANQDMTIEANLNSAEANNAEIETLPPDESSATPSNQLQSGDDKPDVNDLGNGD